MNIEKENESPREAPRDGAERNQRDGEAGMGGEGRLVVHVTTARGAIPLEGAQVRIRNYGKDPAAEDRGDVIASAVTGRGGNTPLFYLPAPPSAASRVPGNQQPFSTYNAEVFSEGFFSQDYINVPIFDGILAIQPADLIPLPENGRTDSRTPDGNRFFESVAPQL